MVAPKRPRPTTKARRWCFCIVNNIPALGFALVLGPAGLNFGNTDRCFSRSGKLSTILVVLIFLGKNRSKLSAEDEACGAEGAVELTMLVPRSEPSFNGNFFPYTHETRRDRVDGWVIRSKVSNKSCRPKPRIVEANAFVVFQGIFFESPELPTWISSPETSLPCFNRQYTSGPYRSMRALCKDASVCSFCIGLRSFVARLSAWSFISDSGIVSKDFRKA
mmetsp:Transcript_4267/g.8877  ORF Transcript_4267/g.8877 Transcript_4267/m.8877 type:complete len:220 (-) Transcript_4267:868-1527(-)